ncbi:MAG TPA: dynamin family protein [Candidatus Limnocylindrales bacterium]|nr:dynamin family protein [Candidatus Limnocylindrales bacterium]
MLPESAGTILEGALAAFREQEIRLTGDLQAALEGMPEGDEDDCRRLDETIRDLREMFYLVVVIGEFNAGKSTFVNALLNEALLPSGITPTTEMIEVVRFSEMAQRVPVRQDAAVRIWAHPNTLAPGVALVDTPGTGSVFKRHEDTAKSFLHRADLVIFVLSAKRALAETERLYLDLARNYGKKIILVINQVDLLKPDEQQQVKHFVERQVEELLQLRPLIFLVSARDALAGDEIGSGMSALKAHLRAVLNESPPARQKLMAQLDFIERVARNNAKRAESRAGLVDSSSLKVRDVERELSQQTGGMDQPLAAARAEINRSLEAMRARGHTFIREHLSLRRLGRSLNREKLQRDFEEVVIGRAVKDIHAASLEYVNALVDGSRAYWRSVIERLNQLHDMLGSDVEGLDANAYAEQREALQEAVRLAEAQLRDYSSSETVRELDERSMSEVTNFAYSFITMAVGLIAAVLALATPGAVAAVPLATLAFVVGAPVALLGGAAAIVYWRRAQTRVRADFDARVDRIRDTYNESLDELMRKERARLQQYGQQVLNPIFSRLEVLTNRFATQRAQLQLIIGQLESLRKTIESTP